jgi:hypothetical protein
MNWESGMVTLLEGGALGQEQRPARARLPQREGRRHEQSAYASGNWHKHLLYYVYERVLGSAKSMGESVLSGVSFDAARSYIIKRELPLRKAHLARMTKWSAIHKKRLVFTPQSEPCMRQNNAA